MRRLDTYLAAALCLTSTVAVLSLLRGASRDASFAHVGDADLACAGGVRVDELSAYPGLPGASRGGADGEPELEESLAGQLLVAHPHMDDRYFAGTVIYMIADDEEGSLGVVLNRPANVGAAGAAAAAGAGVTLWDGGPVGRDRVFVLHDDVDDARSVRLGAELAVAADPAVLERALHAGADDGDAAERPNARVFVGYAGWGPGQLDRELAQGAWLVVDAAPGAVLATDVERVTRTAYARALRPHGD